MIVSQRLGLIFIHIQKTGGSSVEQVLRQLDPSITTNTCGGMRHIAARELRSMLPPGIWEGSRKFAFVRNPWDRLVSWHSMCVQNPPASKFMALVRDRYPDFAHFIRSEEDPELARTRLAQADYLTDEDGARLVDFVGRFERLAEDFARLGLPADLLPWRNASRHRDYRCYYTDELREIVGRRFAKDCAQFGYSFE